VLGFEYEKFCEWFVAMSGSVLVKSVKD